MTIKEFKVQLALGTLTGSIKVKSAKNPNTPKEVLTILSTDKNYCVRWNVASNPNTSKEVLTKLSKDEDEYVRYCVAGNSNTPKEVLTKL